jgi:hypothetical protein
MGVAALRLDSDGMTKDETKDETKAGPGKLAL